MENKLDVLNWDAGKEHVYDAMGHEVPGKLLVRRKDTGSIMAVVSDRYQLVQHRAAVAPLIDKLGPNWYAHKVSLELDGARAFIEMRNDLIQCEVKKGDIIAARALIFNSIDGSSSVGTEFGALRLVCLNGMTRPTGPAFKLNARHTSGVMGQLNLIGDHYRDAWQTMLDSYRALTDRAVSVNVARDLIAAIMGKRATEEVLTLWQAGRGQDGDLTAWALYNGATEYLTHRKDSAILGRERVNQAVLDALLGL